MKTMKNNPELYSVDDRGDRAQFYYDGEIIATINREDEVNGVRDQTTWDGDEDVTEWAKANGYEDEIAEAARVQ